MKRGDTLPLGIDLGTTRVRVALAERRPTGKVHLVAAASRHAGNDPATAIAEARNELGTRERRCVLGIAAPHALLRETVFPLMRSAERRRAARFEAARFAAFPIDDTTLRIVARENGAYVIGAARRSLLAERVNTARRAGLRPVAVDDAAYALMRVFPRVDAIIDAGRSGTSLVIARPGIPFVRRFAIGGGELTAAVAGALGVSASQAEERKCTIGMAGAGDAARDALIDELVSTLTEFRANANEPVRSIALTGNGARLAGLGEALERAIAIPVSVAPLPDDVSGALPSDVLRAAAPDWALAFGLALWDDAA